VTRALVDNLNTGVIDYLTPDNTAVVDVRQLAPSQLPSFGNSGRRLLERVDEVRGVYSAVSK
jgi:hypothetical protein